MRMAGEQLAALAEPHMAALARPGVTQDEVVANMIALSQVMGQQSGYSIGDAIRDPRTPPQERADLIRLSELIEREDDIRYAIGTAAAMDPGR